MDQHPTGVMPIQVHGGNGYALPDWRLPEEPTNAPRIPFLMDPALGAWSEGVDGYPNERMFLKPPWYYNWSRLFPELARMKESVAAGQYREGNGTNQYAIPYASIVNL